MKIQCRFSLISCLAIVLAFCCKPADRYDIVIVNGIVYDGTGQPGRKADVGIVDSRIVAIGDLSDATAGKIVDADGFAVAPGFIDLHAHLEAIDRYPHCENLIRQGVTTALGGPDGGGPSPFGSYLHALKESGVGINTAFLVGHNAVRRNVMGLANRDPSPDELAAMKVQVQTAMEEGAFGLSTGLKYLPGTFSKTEEVIALSAVAAAHGGFYTSHLRDEGLGLLQAVREAITIGREAKIPIVLTHHKVVGKPMWGASTKSLALVDSCRAAGQDVMLDQYPYTASRTGINILIPAWALEGGEAAFASRIADNVLLDSIRRQIVFNLENDRGGGDLRRIQLSNVSWDPSLNGKTLFDWCELQKLPPTLENGAELVIVAESRGDTRCIFHAMEEEDVKRILKHPWTAVASDGILTAPGSAHVHPRAYGTFPRVLARYVREESLLPLEEALRKMTSLPALRLGLTDRGRLSENYKADIVVFDPATIADRSTFADPHHYPQGIKYVLVNGKVVLEGETLSDVRAGEVLYGPGKKQ